jgi:ketosteroid isomerase-like protein
MWTELQNEGEQAVVTVAERNVASAEAYYKAMNDKDVAGVARSLHPDVRFLGPLAELTGKEAVLEAAKRFVNLTKSLRVRAKFGSDDTAMLAYDVDFGGPIGICRTAVLMTFNDGLIASIELFYDARPFEKDLEKDAIFSSR